jgi:DNA ligase-associated metallophosphoesterase
LNTVKLEHRGHAFELSASGAIRWDTTLLVADLHLGKETVFQKSGLAIPSGATQATLQRLQTQIHEMGIKRLVVLGDLLHAAIGWTDDLESMLGKTMQAASGVQWELVAGNHDRRSHQHLRRLGWIVQEPPVFDGNMRWLHEPESPDSPVSANPASEGRTYQTTLCGHLHPSYIVPIDAKRTAKVPCFWIRPDSIVFPAYGGWVGTHAIQPRRQDRVLLCVEGDLIEWNR